MEETLIKELEKKALSIPELAKTIIVKDGETLTRANNALVYIKNLRSQINETFDPIIKKAHEAHKIAVTYKKKTEQPLILAEQYIKPQISSYMAKLERERQEAERKQRELERAEKEFGLEPSSQLKPIPTAQPKLKGVSIAKIWKYRIVDKKIIPAEYWMLDLVRIGQVGRESKGQAKILGVEFYSEDVVKGRATI